MCSVNVCMVCHGQSVQIPKSGGPVTCGCVHYDCSFFVCAHLTLSGVCVHAKFDIFTSFSFFFNPLSSYFTKVRFPCYFFTITIDHRRWSLLAEILHQQARLLFVPHISFRWQLKKQGVEWTGGGGGQSYLFLSGRLPLLHSTPFIATPNPTGPALRCFPSCRLRHCRHRSFSQPSTSFLQQCCH